MSVTMPRMMLMASLLSLASMWPSVSTALGLGEIHLNSALNEPMNAEIDLIAASPEELAALRATLAPRDAFTRYGIDRPAFLSSLTFKVAKGKEGRDVLQVRSSEAIPEPFVTFLVEVNWARGRLMREYTVLLDPPVYTPGENPNTTAPVTAPMTADQSTPAATAARTPAASVASPSSSAPASVSAPTATSASKTARRRSGHRPAAAPAAEPSTAETPAPPVAESAPEPPPSEAAGPGTVRVMRGDTLTKIARSLHPGSAADVDQTMIALYRSNRDAFGGNINVLRSGAVLRVPNADEIAALNQKEAMGEVHRQMDAWRGGAPSAPSTAAAPSGHLRLVTPTGGGSGTTSGAGDSAAAATAANAQNQALKERVKDLEGQLAESKRLIDLKSSELADLQHKLAAQTPPAPVAPLPQPPKVVATAPAPSQPVKQEAPPQVAPPPVPPPPTAQQPPPAEVAPPAEVSPPPSAAPPPPEATMTPVPPPAVTPPPAKKPIAVAPAPAESGSWLDWVSDHWWIPVLAVLAALLALLGVNAMRKRRQGGGGGGTLDDVDPVLEETHVADLEPAKLTAIRKGNESFIVEESGPHPLPDFTAESGRFGDTGELKSADDTLSSESAVNLDQGDPLAEADFHMAYGLYDQAADLVRIALEREPDRRDLRMKLLEIYFVWGNKDAFLQTARGLESTRDRAPAGEWDKILIMGKQICPDEPLFAASAGSGRGAGALVDLNLEGGENRVDIDLFGEPEGSAKEHDDTAVTGESPGLRAAADSGLDFTLDAPERGADESPTREIPQRDEPTVESEMINFADAPTTESPALKTAEMKSADMRDRITSKLGARPDQTAEVSIDDLGLELDQLEQTGHPAAPSFPTIPELEDTESDHPADAPTMVAGLDERSRRMMEEAAKKAQDRDLTELERELEASFIADFDQHQDEVKTAVLGPEAAPTVLMAREGDPTTISRLAATGRMKEVSPGLAHAHDGENGADLDSTSKLREINADSIDLDLDRLATALSGGDTREQPRAAEEVFSTEVFEASHRNRRVDLDVGEALNGSDHSTNKLQVSTNRLKPIDLPLPEMEPVTMSEVGTKLDLARAYMDMGDPEGARSILEEVVQEGSASQKQEASRLIESLPG